MAYRIGVDIGGTFTDFVMYDDETGTISTEKVPTTPAEPEIGCIAAVDQGAPAAVLVQSGHFLHGTTVGLNALLERRGAVVGLLCTEGFRDSLEIRRGSRPERFSLDWTPPEPLVPRHLRLGVKERMGPDGAEIRPLDAASVREALDTFRAHGVTSIAIAFINAYANPGHELAAADALRAAGWEGAISCSHQVSREYRDYERASTTVIDAFVRTRMADYLGRLETGLRDRGFAGASLITRSGGGCMGFAEAKERAFETINSGPVAGAEGAAELARAFGLGDLVTADVGGTSFDTSLIRDGRPELLYRGEIADMPLLSPWVDVRSIGAGGGSIAYVDVGGLLQVGPQSAGAVPGPACYGRGGTLPTTTDAALLLGMLGDGLLASDLRLDRDKATAAMEPLAKQLGYTVRQTAIGIIRIACANMANAIREITIERGVDPRALKLLPFGGAGPMLATQIARELDVPAVVVPPYAGNFSAWGLLGSDLIRSTARTKLFPLSEEGLRDVRSDLAEMFAELEGRGGKTEDEASPFRHGIKGVGLGLRFVGQEHDLTIPVAETATVEEITADFREAYLQAFGLVLDYPVEVIAIRAEIRVPLPRRVGGSTGSTGAEAAPGSCLVHSFALDRDLTAETRRRADLAPGCRYAGPAIVYEETTTTYVDADFDYGLDDNGCLRLDQKDL